MRTDHERYKLVEAVGRLVDAGAEFMQTPKGRRVIVLPEVMADMTLPTFEDLEAERERIADTELNELERMFLAASGR